MRGTLLAIMNAPAVVPPQAAPLLPLAERLVLAHSAVADPKFRALCFWNWPEQIEVTETSLSRIASALRLHGGREGFSLGAKLCPSEDFRRIF